MLYICSNREAVAQAYHLDTTCYEDCHEVFAKAARDRLEFAGFSVNDYKFATNFEDWTLGLLNQSNIPAGDFSSGLVSGPTEHANHIDLAHIAGHLALMEYISLIRKDRECKGLRSI